jgi:phage terminase large subunit GpA-like protein
MVSADEATDVEYADIEAALNSVRALWAPPPRLLVSEFADKHLIVTSGPLATTRWNTAFMPYQAGILDAFFEPGIEIVVLQASSQVGKTSAALVTVAYHIVHDPCPILVVEPTVDPMAKDFSKNRLEPIIAASPPLRDSVSKARAKDSSNTVLQKTYKGGSLSIGGANSAASLAARTIRLLILDEIDRYPPELPGEGATIQIALKRTAAFRGRRRVMLLSSPTLKGAPIDSWFQRGDQRRFYVPCPSCDYMHPFAWRNVKWQDGDASTARLHCPDCDYAIDDAERVAILNKGEWRAEQPDRRESSIASFHIWEAYSPLSSLPEIVSSFLAAREAQKGGDRSLMHTWQNTTLGEAIELDAGEGVESSALLVRREAYGEGIDAPAGVACITMGVDVQDDRLEALVIGWGLGEESWLIDRQTLPGDTSQPEPWKMLDELLENEYKHESGQRLPIQATCIDSGGHRTTLVYDYARRQAARRVFAIIGRDGQRPIVSSPSPKRSGTDKRKVPLYTIGVDAAKALWVSRFKIDEKGRGYVHIPLEDWADDGLAAQLTSERLVTTWHKGIPKQIWQQTRPRNEALDCVVYALAALRLLHPNLELLAQRITDPSAPAPAPKPKRERWIPRREGWLK